MTLRSHNLVKCSAYARTGHFGFLMIKHEISCFSPNVSRTNDLRLSWPERRGAWPGLASLCACVAMKRAIQLTLKLPHPNSLARPSALDWINSVLSRLPEKMDDHVCVGLEKSAAQSFSRELSSIRAGVLSYPVRVTRPSFQRERVQSAKLTAHDVLDARAHVYLCPGDPVAARSGLGSFW